MKEAKEIRLSNGHKQIILVETLCFFRRANIKYHFLPRKTEVVKQFPAAETCFFCLLIINGLIFLELRKSVDLTAVSPLICNASSSQSYRGLLGIRGTLLVIYLLC